MAKLMIRNRVKRLKGAHGVGGFPKGPISEIKVTHRDGRQTIIPLSMQNSDGSLTAEGQKLLSESRA